MRAWGSEQGPVFELETDELPEELRYRPDLETPERHRFIEPAHRMLFDEYQRAVHGIRAMWCPVRLMRSVMEQAKQPDVAERVADLALYEDYRERPRRVGAAHPRTSC